MVTIVARLIDHNWFQGTSSVSTMEWITLAILIILVLLFEGLVWKLPSERKQTEKKIQTYFDEHEI